MTYLRIDKTLKKHRQRARRLKALKAQAKREQA